MVKKSILVFLILVGTISLSLTLRIGIWDDYPLAYVKDNKAAGIYVDLLDEIAKKEGWKIFYRYYKWEDLFPALARGQIDCLGPIADTKSRRHEFTFNSEAFFQNWGVIVSKKTISSIFDLEGKTIGIGIDDVYGHFLEEMLKSFSVKAEIKEAYNSFEDIAKDVASGKIDAGVMSRITAFMFVNKYKYHISSIVFRPASLKLAFPKNSTLAKEVIPVIDKYLKKWKADPNSIYWKSVTSYLGAPKGISKNILIVITILTIFVVSFVFVIFIQYMFSRKLKAELEKATAQIKERNKELEELNKELEIALKKSEESMNKSFEIMKHISQIANLEVDEEEFMQKLLEIALEYLEPAKYGSIFILDEKGRMKMIASVGHNKELFNRHEFKETFAFYYDKPVIVKEILDVDKRILDPEDYKVITKISKPIKESLIVPIAVENSRIGTLTVDIPPSEEGDFTEHHVKIAESFSRIAATFITFRDHIKIKETFHKNIILILAKALDFYSPYTKGHSERVADLSAKIAEEMGLSKDEVRKVYWAGIIHDVGKIFVPQDIINKPERLTGEEYELIKLHAIKSAEIIKEIEGLEEIANIVRHHHERCDGTGYPDGLKCHEIPLEAKIIAVADAFDAMTSERPYREALTPEEALNEIIKNSGTQFDPQVVQAFVRVFHKLYKEETA